LTPQQEAFVTNLTLLQSSSSRGPEGLDRSSAAQPRSDSRAIFPIVNKKA